MLEYKTFKGKEIIDYIDLVSQFRIENFKEFPYLYKGNMEYEREYLEGFSSNLESRLILVYENKNVIGISTSLPFLSEYDILEDGPSLFKSMGKNPRDFFYFGEVIISSNFREKGICKEIFRIQEKIAKQLNYKDICFLTVVRDRNDPRMPINYSNPSSIWDSLGYKPIEEKTLNFEWPTIHIDGTVKNIENPMKFWLKEL